MGLKLVDDVAYAQRVSTPASDIPSFTNLVFITWRHKKQVVPLQILDVRISGHCGEVGYVVGTGNVCLY